VKSNASSNEFEGQHAVKMLGWGIDPASKLPYWLIANSWSADWGQNGFFQILRGDDECGIETNAAAGLPGTTSPRLLSKPSPAPLPPPSRSPLRSLSSASSAKIITPEMREKFKQEFGSRHPKRDSPKKPSTTPPTFPPQFFCNITLEGEFVQTINGTWWFDYTNQRERIGFFMLGHDEREVYRYDLKSGYYLQGFFDSTICYTQDLMHPTLPPGIPSAAVFEGAYNCGPDNNIPCELWLYYEGALTSGYYVSSESPYWMLEIGQSLSPLDTTTYYVSNCVAGPSDESVFAIPSGQCDPYPGPWWPPVFG